MSAPEQHHSEGLELVTAMILIGLPAAALFAMVWLAVAGTVPHGFVLFVVAGVAVYAVDRRAKRTGY